MFYYRIEKTTAAVPRVTSTGFHEFGGWRHAGDYVQGILAGGEYAKVTVEAIDQATFKEAKLDAAEGEGRR
jgi:hypothetical protein